MLSKVDLSGGESKDDMLLFRKKCGGSMHLNYSHWRQRHKGSSLKRDRRQVQVKLGDITQTCLRITGRYRLMFPPLQGQAINDAIHSQQSLIHAYQEEIDGCKRIDLLPMLYIETPRY